MIIHHNLTLKCNRLTETRSWYLAARAFKSRSEAAPRRRSFKKDMQSDFRKVLQLKTVLYQQMKQSLKLHSSLAS